MAARRSAVEIQASIEKLKAERDAKIKQVREEEAARIKRAQELLKEAEQVEKRKAKRARDHRLCQVAAEFEAAGISVFDISLEKWRTFLEKYKDTIAQNIVMTPDERAEEEERAAREKDLKAAERAAKKAVKEGENERY